MEKKFQKLLKKNEIQNIFIVGAVDIDDEISFIPDLRYLYFMFDTFYILFKSVEQYSKLSFAIVDSIQYDYYVDEDMLKAKTSISDIVLDNSGAIGNDIRKIALYDFDNTNNICSAAELFLSNGQIIFIDPSFLFGINIGGTRQKKIWKDNYINGYEPTTSIINILQ